MEEFTNVFGLCAPVKRTFRAAEPRVIVEAGQNGPRGLKLPRISNIARNPGVSMQDHSIDRIVYAGSMGTGSVVWILGAGFSKPLGGPLLSDFFSEHSKVLFPLTRPSTLDRNVELVYEIGLKGTHISGALNLDLWTDPEEYLTYLGDVLQLLCDDFNTSHPKVTALREITEFKASI